MLLVGATLPPAADPLTILAGFLTIGTPVALLWNQPWMAWALVFLAGATFHPGLTVDTPVNAVFRTGGAGLLTLGFWFWLNNVPGSSW